MAERKALVLSADGRIEQLPNGDTLEGAASGGSGGSVEAYYSSPETLALGGTPSTSSSAYASKGNIFTVGNPLRITGMDYEIEASGVGGAYEAVVAKLSSYSTGATITVIEKKAFVPSADVDSIAFDTPMQCVEGDVIYIGLTKTDIAGSADSKIRWYSSGASFKTNLWLREGTSKGVRWSDNDLQIGDSPFDLTTDWWATNPTFEKLNALLPAGGTTGQLLSKVDGSDYNTQWIDAPSGGSGGGGGGVEGYTPATATFLGSSHSTDSFSGNVTLSAAPTKDLIIAFPFGTTGYPQTLTLDGKLATMLYSIKTGGFDGVAFFHIPAGSGVSSGSVPFVGTSNDIVWRCGIAVYEVDNLQSPVEARMVTNIGDLDGAHSLETFKGGFAIQAHITRLQPTVTTSLTEDVPSLAVGNDFWVGTSAGLTDGTNESFTVNSTDPRGASAALALRPLAYSLADAPSDGKSYVRKDGDWAENTAAIVITQENADFSVGDVMLGGGIYKEVDTASANVTVTVPENLTGNQPVIFENIGDNDVIFVAGTNVTINSFDGNLKLGGKFASGSLVPKGSNVFTLTGNLKA